MVRNIYNTIPKSKDWFIANCAVNVVGGFLLTFYIFKGERPQQDYIKDCKPDNVKEGLDDSLFIQGVSKLFQKVSS
jgi:hypothetical protein